MIELRSVGKNHLDPDGTDRAALRDITLDLPPVDFVAICGPAGSGKSALLRLLSCLDVPSTGELMFQGADISALSEDELAQLRLRHVGFVFRRPYVIPELTVRDNVELPLMYAGETSYRHARSSAALTVAGMFEKADVRAGTLDSAELSLTSLARALVNDPAIVAADEPFAVADEAMAGRLLDLLRTLADDHLVVFTTDDPVVAQAARRVLWMQYGAVRADPAGVAPPPPAPQRPTRAGVSG